jgi:hypothetical protein
MPSEPRAASLAHATDAPTTEVATLDKPFGVLSVAIDLDTQRVDEAALASLPAYKRLVASKALPRPWPP